MTAHADGRSQFLVVTAWFMSGMAALAWILSEISGTRPLSSLNLTWANLGLGVLAALLMSSLLCFARAERALAREALGHYVAACRWPELLVLAAVVGFCEEWLFRGVLELWVARWDRWGAMITVNLLFGLLHALSVRYALLAFALGIVLSLLVQFPEPPSLFRAMIAHGLYDFVAFLVIARDHRLLQQRSASAVDSVEQQD